MADPHRPEDVAQYNKRSLEKLTRAIALSQGEFSLILVRCNYRMLQREMLLKLQDQSSVEIRELVLYESAKNLYQAIQAQIEAQRLVSVPNGLALMVLGLESVVNLDDLLSAANQIRGKFHDSFQFPLVLWINDEVLQKLVRLAPDVNSWAGVPIKFSLPTDILIDALRQNADKLFDHVLDTGSGQFLPNSAIFGVRYRAELEAALRDLQSRDIKLEPALDACKLFALGRDEYTNDQIELALEHYQQSLAFWQQGSRGSGELGSREEENPKSNSLPSLSKGGSQNLKFRAGVLLFHIGLCYYRSADLNRLDSRQYLEKARDSLQQCLDVLESAQMLNWVAKFIGQLGEVLRRLEAWDELQILARKCLVLHQATGNQVQLAQDYGFLAEVALKRYGVPCPPNWAKKANKLAQKALQTLNKAPEPRPQHWGLYILLLAQSQQYLNQQQEAINNLEAARKAGHHHYDPQLYIRILDTLRSLYFTQGKYRSAFQIKREQRSIEQQYGFLAFVGANRLQPQLQPINPALPQIEQQATVAQEIVASGRQKDVDYLFERIARNDCKLTVIYGQSGVGKSSLITAGLLPALKQSLLHACDPLPVVLRVYNNWINDLGNHLVEALQEMRGFNLATPLDSVASIIEQLKKNEERNLLTILVFDQLEELFISRSFIDRESRSQFYSFLQTCFNLPLVKVIFAIREDYLSYLLECNRLTDLSAINNNILDRDNLYYLGNFSLQDAWQVIQSLTNRSQIHLEPPLVDELVQDLASDVGEVRPIELQVVGAQLQAEDITTIDKYHQLGPKAKLVRRFLEEAIGDCGPENERIARLVLYLLTDENSTRPLKTHAELVTGLVAESSELKPEKLDFVLEILVRSGLLLLWPLPINCYQLVHDYLVPFIQQEKDAEFGKKLEKATEERQRVEDQLHRVRQWRRLAVVSAGVAIALAASAVIFALKAEFLKQRAEIAEANSASEARLLSNDQLGALVASTQASIKLQETEAPFSILLDRLNIRRQTADRLQQTLSIVQERNRLESHQGSVLGVSFSPDGSTIASASDDKTIKLWKRNGTLLRTLRNHTQPVTSVSFSPDGQTIASTSADKTIKLWKLKGRAGTETPLVQTLTGHKDTVFSVSFSSDSQMIASASKDKTVRLWRRDGTSLKTLTGHRDTVFSVSFSPDGRTIASASADKTVKLWKRDGTLIKTLTGHTDKVLSVSFSPDGETIASASADKTVKLWKRDGTLIKTLTGHSKPVHSVSFSRDGKTIASASEDNTVKLWSRPGGILLKTLVGHKNWVLSVSFSLESGMLASASADSTVKLWSRESPFRNTLVGHTKQVTNVSFSPDGQTIASASADNTVKLWQRDGRTGTEALPLKTLKGHKDEVFSVNFSPDGQTIASASADKTVKLWKRNGTLFKTLTGHRDKVLSVSFSSDAQMIASASKDRTVKLWSLDGQLLRTLEGHSAAVNWVSFSPDSQTIASASDDNTVKLWNLDGTLRTTLAGHRGHVNWVSFSPDGQMIASASDDQTVKLWNLDGEEIRTLKGHIGKVWSVSFSADDQTIASSSDDNTVKLWSRDGTPIYTLKGYSGPVFSVSFSPDGKILASASDDSTVILRSLALEPHDLLVRGCDWLHDYLKTNLSASESVSGASLQEVRHLCDGIDTQK